MPVSTKTSAYESRDHAFSALANLVACAVSFVDRIVFLGEDGLSVCLISNEVYTESGSFVKVRPLERTKEAIGPFMLRALR
jgi:hypothetical protein